MLRPTCSTARKQMTRAAAILAMALLCAQTLFVVHDHQISESELCAVCGTTVEHSDSSAPTAFSNTCSTTTREEALDFATPANQQPETCRARAPPTA